MVVGTVGVKKGRAFYAWFVEMGSRKMAAQPFLGPALFNNLVAVLRMLEGA